MQIRSEQVDKFQTQQFRQFEARAMSHVRRAFGHQCRSMGDAGARTELRRGVARALALGIVTERDVMDYVDLTFMLGRDFDAKVPWAGPILQDEASSPEDRLRRVRYMAGKQVLARKDRWSRAGATASAAGAKADHAT